MPEIPGKSLLSVYNRRSMSEQTVHECPGSSDRLPFTEAEAEALLRAWKRKERERRGNTLEAAAEKLIERSNRRSRPLWKRQKRE